MLIRRFMESEITTFAHIDDSRFDELFVRKSEIGITISMIYAKNPGNGAFTSLIKEIREKYNCSILVEGPTRRFKSRLLKMGFIKLCKLQLYILPA